MTTRVQHRCINSGLALMFAGALGLASVAAPHLPDAQFCHDAAVFLVLAVIALNAVSLLVDQITADEAQREPTRRISRTTAVTCGREGCGRSAVIEHMEWIPVLGHVCPAEDCRAFDRAGQEHER